MESVMRKLLFSAVILLVAVAGSARAQQPAPVVALPSIELPSALDRVLRDYERAWRARDAASLAELFTEDGFVLGNGSPPARGRAAIRTAYANGGGPLSLRALAYAMEGRVGYIIGAFGHAPGEPDSGKFVLALRQGSDGRWQIAADMDNSNRRTWVAPIPTATPLLPKREK
jgi:ketosteroid isomerase-like protein